MIPLKLTLRGFLSYQEPTEIDFSALHVACILGRNGAGKSSILDGITWALFGKARKNDDSIINSAIPDGKAWAELDFLYEGLFYRVRREKTRAKSSSSLSFLFRENEAEEWRSLTEKRVTDTNERICEVLRMDYDTFVNVSFFLQGKADSFTGQKPGDRKTILSKILNLDVWEDYKNLTAKKRKDTENTLNRVEGDIADCDAELAEEDARRAALAEIENRLAAESQRFQQLNDRWTQAKLLESTLNSLKENAVNLGRDAEKLRRQTERQTAERDRIIRERNALVTRLKEADRIEANYQALQQVRAAIGAMTAASQEYYALNQQLQLKEAAITAQGNQLKFEYNQLKKNEDKREKDAMNQHAFTERLEKAQADAQPLEKTISENAILPQVSNNAFTERGSLITQMKRLKKEGDQLKVEIAQMDRRQGTQCPTCGHWVEQADCAAFREEKEAKLQQMREEYAEAQKRAAELDEQLKQMENSQALAKEASEQLDRLRQEITTLQIKRDTLAAHAEERAEASRRQQELQRILDNADYCRAERSERERILAELDILNFDQNKYEVLKAKNSSLTSAEKQYQQLLLDRQSAENLDKDIDRRNQELKTAQADAAEKAAQYEKADAEWKQQAQELPDMKVLKAQCDEANNSFNRLQQDLGSAQQLLSVLDGVRRKREDLRKKATELRLLQSRYEQLEKAFGKKGIPSLLMEQALPEVEEQANELLQRLSDGNMSLRFDTQKAYKTKKDEQMETLDILISDAYGVRPYEMFSGGEAFRINFSIRLALSQLLTRRAGSRLQTLVIDEGFGSQDDEGRARLVEAIEAIRPDFEKILIITHLDELKDAFESRIEVSKTASGTEVKVCP